MDTTSDLRTPTAPELVRARPPATTNDSGGAVSKLREDPAANQSRTFLEALLRALSVWSS